MKATNKLALALALVLGSSQALALGLGQIRVKSALNQPLRAEIPVLADNAAELNGLRVALASPEDFARAGLRMSRVDVPLTFKLVRQGGGAVIEISSEQPVGEPALDFLIEVNWANGKLLREYSVLLDPPTRVVSAPVTRAAPASAAAPRAPAPRPASASAPAPSVVTTGASTAPARTSVPASVPSSIAGETYTVAAGDTLWRIASAASAGGDVNRTMLAIQRANPEAFLNGNVNSMRRGAVLRIPGHDEVQRVSAAEARSEIRRQMDQWHASRATAPSVLAQSGGDAAAAAAPARGNTTADSHLELVPPGDANGGEGRSGVQGGTGSAEVAGLQSELARARESLASEQQKSGELGERVKSLEDINDKNRRLLELKNSEIAELQNKLAAAREVAETSTAAAAATVVEAVAPAVAASAEQDIWGKDVTGAASAVEPATSATASPAAMASVAETAAAASVAATPAPVAATPAETATPDATPTPAPARPATPIPEDAQPWYMRPVTWLVAGLVALGLLLLGLLSRRRKPASIVDHDAIEDDATAMPYGDDGDDEYALLDEIEQHPEELSLHLELASLYYAHRDVEKFEAAAERMHAYVNDPQEPEWQQVRAMGEELSPDHPLFGDTGDDVFASGDYDDNALSDAAVADAPEPSPSMPSSRGYNFDFDLTPSAAASAPAMPEEAIDFGEESFLDHGEDLGLDEDVSDSVPEAGSLSAPEHAADIHFTDFASDGAGGAVSDEGFSSDPVDTKLDLARAYQEMGDAEGARAMLEEVLQEGSAVQKDVARKLLDDLT